jgi:UDP-GlcNAc:undecaprenyl-phosphate GlcNAc-1-phosphate transferase
MNSPITLIILFSLLALVYSLIATPLVIKLSKIRGWVVAPRQDRWHTKPTALMGGIAIYFSFVSLIIVSSIYFKFDWLILLAFTIMFVTGLVDDLKELKPIYKLLAQVMAAFILIYKGYIFGNELLGWIGVPITFLWVIGITNAINLLDNMDGLSAGISTIIALIIGSISVIQGDMNTALLSFVLAGATLGFLRYNFNPAKIFMGDSGSLFLGYTLSFLALSVQKNLNDSSVYIVMLLPVILMVIPILDTSLVTIKRVISGRKIYIGGKDHTSHRLVAMGLSERKAVLILYGIGLLWGLTIVLLSSYKDTSLYMPILSIFLIATVFFGLFLSNVKVYNESEEKMAYLRSRGQNVEAGGVLLRLLLMNKKIIFGVSFDILIISASFYFTAKVTGMDASANYTLLALFILIKIVSFFIANSYRKTWRYISFSDLNSNFSSGFVASVLLFLLNILFALNPEMPVFFFLIDFIFSFSGTIMMRLFFKYFRETILRYRNHSHKVIIYGAGELGYLLSKQLFTSDKYKFKPVAFIDDDVTIKNTIINGIEIMGTPDEVLEVCKLSNANIVIAASSLIEDEKLIEMKLILQKNNIRLIRFEARMLEI